MYYISKDGKLKLIDYKTDYVEKGEENKLIEEVKEVIFNDQEILNKFESYKDDNRKKH